MLINAPLGLRLHRHAGDGLQSAPLPVGPASYPSCLAEVVNHTATQRVHVPADHLPLLAVYAQRLQ